MLCVDHVRQPAFASRFHWVVLLAIALFSVFPSKGYSESLMPGANLVQMTTNGKSRIWRASPRGEWLAYLKDVSNTQAQLRVMRVDGSEDRAVSAVGNPFFIAWSWAGDRLSYEFTSSRTGDSQGNAFIYDFEGDRSYPISQTYSYDALAGRSGGGDWEKDGDWEGFGGGSRSARQDVRPGLNDYPYAEGPVWSIDDKFVAFSVSGSGGSDEVWVSDALSGKYERILAQRSGVSKQQWSSTTPSRLTLCVVASGRNVDIATVSPDGTNLTMLTDIGSDSIGNGSPYWSPTGEWIAYSSDLKMTEQEQRRGRADYWVARPDGSDVRNLTQATSNTTEDQISLDWPEWSWDGKYILVYGSRFDQQGRSISALYLIKPEGGYETILTTDPAVTSETEYPWEFQWSYDSTKIAILTERYRVRDWTGDRTHEDHRTGISIYDIETKTLHDVLLFNEDSDLKTIDGEISWSPDSKSIWITVNKIISSEEGIVQPDVFRLDLPPELAGDPDARFHGPPIGVGARNKALIVAQAPTQNETDTPSPVVPTQTAVTAPTHSTRTAEEIIVIVEPQHLTIAEIAPLIPDAYNQYLKSDTSRNMFVFVGPASVHQALLADLEVIDYPAAHIVVDFLAIETSDAINRELGLDWAYTKGRFSIFTPEGKGIGNFTSGFQVLPSPSIYADGVDEDGNFLNLNPSIADRFGVDNVAGLLTGGLGTFPGVGQALFSGVGKLPEEFFVNLSALQQNGEITILANPRTVATSGKESVIQIRRVVNFFFTEGVSFQTGTPNVRKSDVTATTEGRITPTLLANGKVHMALDINVGTVTFGAEDLPQQIDRKASTEVTVAPGDTIIIGGLRQQEHKITRTQTPILGNIPFLGKLFRKTKRETHHSVLTILITPHVMGQETPPPTLPDPNWPKYEMNDTYKTPIMSNGSFEQKKPNKIKTFFNRGKFKLRQGKSNLKKKSGLW